MAAEFETELGSWSTERLLHAAAFEQSEYTDEALVEILALLKQRGVGTGDITAYRADIFRRRSLEVVCENCQESLILDREDIVAGEFTCPLCSARQYVTYPAMSFDPEPEEALEAGRHDEAGGIKEEEEAAALEVESQPQPADVPASCALCHRPVAVADVFSHRGELYCEGCYQIAVSNKFESSETIEDERSDSRQLGGAEASREKDSTPEEAIESEAEAGVGEFEVDSEESDVSMQVESESRDAVESAHETRTGIRGGLLFLMLNLILLFAMQAVDLVLRPIFSDPTLKWFGISHIAVLGYLIILLAYRKHSFKLNFFLYLYSLGALYLLLTILNPSLVGGGRIGDYPLYAFIRHAMVIAIWTFYFLKSDRPGQTLVN